MLNPQMRNYLENAKIKLLVDPDFDDTALNNVDFACKKFFWRRSMISWCGNLIIYMCEELAENKAFISQHFARFSQSSNQFEFETLKFTRKIDNCQELIHVRKSNHA